MSRKTSGALKGKLVLLLNLRKRQPAKLDNINEP
jgi:hypothetical protein